MGKKITSSSPINTIAFDAIPATHIYSSDIKVHKVDATNPSFGSGGTGGYYTSTAGNSNTGGAGGDGNTGPVTCPIGKHMNAEGICVKNKKESRRDRLTRKMREDEAMGKTASAARKRKRLGAYELGQEKRTKQIEEGQTFFGRLGRNVKDIFLPGYDHDGSGTSLARSRKEMKVSRAKDIKIREEDRTKCLGNPKKKWENGNCVDKPGTQNKPYPNLVNTSSFISTSGNIIPGFGTGIQPKPQKPCPKGQTRVGRFCV